MLSYETVTEALQGLKQQGFTTDFNVEFDCITCHQTPVSLGPSEFEIVDVFRFEGNTDPADEAVVYAIESKHGLKGVLVNGYGISADSLSDDMIKKLAIKHS